SAATEQGASVVDPGAWLERYGWQPRVYDVVERFGAYGRPAPMAMTPGGVAGPVRRLVAAGRSPERPRAQLRIRSGRASRRSSSTRRFWTPSPRGVPSKHTERQAVTSARLAHGLNTHSDGHDGCRSSVLDLIHVILPSSAA